MVYAFASVVTLSKHVPVVRVHIRQPSILDERLS